jgi:hypothetical protein
MIYLVKLDVRSILRLIRPDQSYVSLSSNGQAIFKRLDSNGRLSYTHDKGASHDRTGRHR